MKKAPATPLSDGPQAAASAISCRWSFKRLWVAAISRHSDRQADLPRRWKRLILRLNFICAKTGSRCNVSRKRPSAPSANYRL